MFSVCYDIIIFFRQRPVQCMLCVFYFYTVQHRHIFLDLVTLERQYLMFPDYTKQHT